MALVPAANAAQLTTATTLAISSTTVPYKTPITLTATVTSGGTPVSAGLVLFCDASATYCENNSALGIAQLTKSNATAEVKIGSGPIGNHSYKAVFIANKFYASSTSNTVSYSVTGTYASQTTLSDTGSPGNYTLNMGVSAVGAVTAGPTGSISIVDTSDGNNILGTQSLQVSTLSDSFVQEAAFPVGGPPPPPPAQLYRSVAVESAYLNGDNNLDVVTGDAANTVSVMLGNGDGTFQPQANYSGCPSSITGDVATKILLADFNRDGNTDIVLGCSNASEGGVVILLGNGDGTFQAPMAYATGDVFSLALGDFNNDGILDIAVSDQTQQNITILIGKGDGTFTLGTSITTATQTKGIVAGDFNGDGTTDIAFAQAEATGTLSDLYVALGKGDGTFSTPTKVATGIGEFLTAGDTDADNITDIVSTTITLAQPPNGYVQPSMWVLLGKGNGTFQTPVVYSADYPSDPHLADVNGDGKPDIIAGGSTGALVFYGNGDGTFQPYIEPTIGGFSLTYAVNAGDYNNDGNADLVGTDANSAQAAVSLSQVVQSSTALALTNIAVFPLGSGVHQVDASYPGDSIYLASLSPTVSLTAAPTPTTLTLSASPTTATLAGQTVTFTATLSPYTVGPPTTTTNGETVMFYSGGSLIGTGALNNGVATLATGALPVGTDSVQATFPGDSNYDTSNSNSVSVTVANIVLTSSLNPSMYQQSVTFTATLGNSKSGSVNFVDGSDVIGTVVVAGTSVMFTTSSLSVGSHDITAVYGSSTSPVLIQVVNKAVPAVTVTTSGPSVYGNPVTITASVPSGPTGTITISSGSTTLGSGTINNGIVTITTSTLPTGSDPVTATYNGDGNYATATGTTTQVVSKASPSSTLTSSLNPSTPGVSVTFTDALPTSVTGTVTFKNGSTVLGTSTVTNGTATVTSSTLPTGSDAITATYSGDTNNNGSTATLTQTVNKNTPTVTVATSGPSTYGTPVSITATVTSGATGTVTFTSGSQNLGSGTISGGTVTISTSVLPAGTDTITASYGGDANNNAATGTTTQVVSKVTTTSLTLTSSANPSTFGQSVTFAATVSAGATGTVTFTSGSTVIGTATISSNRASVTTSTLPVGSDAISASYGGDSNFNSATASLTQTVNKATPALTLTSSTNPSTANQSVTFTATLPSTVTGTVTFKSGATVIGTSNVSNGVAAVSTATLPVGSNSITATYNGDANDNTASASLTQTVNKATPTITLTSSANPSSANQSVTFTATLPSGVTGTVTFSTGATALGTTTVNNGVASVVTSTLPVGSDPITAVYSGDSSDNTATASLTQTVNKVTPAITLTSSNNPSSVNQPVTFIATLPLNVTGTITFTSGSNVIGTSNISNGSAAVTTSTLPVGSDVVTATYSGDTNNNTATTNLTQTVNSTPSTITLISSSNPSTVNQPVTFTATVPSTATGTVTFTNGSTVIGTSNVNSGNASVTTSTLPIGSDAITATYSGDSTHSTATASITQTVDKATPTITVTTSGPSTYGQPVTITTTLPPGTTGTVTVTSGGTTLGSGTVSAGGTVTITTSTLPVGTNPITASYGGDSNNNPATGSTTQTVNKDTPVLPPPVATPSNPVVGTTVTITETVPSGVGGPVTFSNGTTTIGTAPIVNGVATITVSNLPIGSNPITASTPGDANNNPATSPATTVTVNKATPTVTLTSSSNPSTPGAPVTFTATVYPGATAPVTFYDGTTAIGTGVPNAAGVATFTTSTLSSGSHSITASYPGDSNYSPATSPVLTQVVGKISSMITLTESSPAELLGTSVTFTAVVTAPVPTPTGTVTFMDGNTVLGTAPLSTNGGVVVTLTSGNAAYSTSSLLTGDHKITAVYSGDNSFSSSTSASVDNVVEDFTITNSGSASQQMLPGASGTYNFNLSPVGSSTFVDNVSLTVTGLPEGSTYTLTPSSAAAGSGEAALVLTVNTSSSLTAENRAPMGGPNSHHDVPVALGILGLAGLGTIRKLRKKLPRPLLVLLLMIATLLPVAALSGCAGGYFAFDPHTYTVTVTGTEGSIQHSATATLVVQ
ncbi:Ig-like domain repeat protein [Edaphobacter acidisoli]|uniref:Ig-like domain repeat protein n=1 Tax=Edaphobacter acidisoli TaxID=2040573 RepID=UPI00166F2B98|nr:Ig-like domain repeat protein [Edaphobacter acidisoli]